jgi:hypothetical protein
MRIVCSFDEVGFDPHRALASLCECVLTVTSHRAEGVFRLPILDCACERAAGEEPNRCRRSLREP